MGLFIFVFAIVAVIPALFCLFLLFSAEFHCRFCTWSYLWFGECLGLWQLWVAAHPESGETYWRGISVLLVTNAALALYLFIQRRRRQAALAAASMPDAGKS